MAALQAHLAGMPLPQVAVAACRQLAVEPAPAGAPPAAARPVDGEPSPPGHVQAADVRDAQGQVDAVLCGLGLRPVQPALAAGGAGLAAWAAAPLRADSKPPP